MNPHASRPGRRLTGLVLLCVLCGGLVCPAQTPKASGPAPAQPDAAESIGSTRNGRVAFPMSGAKVPLTFLAGELSEEQRVELAQIAPNVHILSGLSREQAMAHAAEAHGADGRFCTPEFLEHAPNLVWVQSPSAGVDRFMRMKPLVESDRIVLTNMRAVHGPAIADHAFAMLLTLTRGMRAHAEDQAAGRWGGDDPEARPIALQGRTMLVVGLGGIGTEIAQRAHGFGMRVIATRRTDAASPDFVARVGRPEDLTAMLPEADVVAICVPLTAETDHLIGAAALAAMKPGSYLINIARGRIVDTDALVAALKSGNLAKGGACLDVTDPEPLPAGHPLWAMKNVVITPHTAADAELTRERAWTLLRENVRRFGAGEPLLNVVDKKAGY
jgi:phosphoglycerate dehydrogenase-like enzyme